MNPQAVLIQTPAVNWGFLSATRQALGRNLAAAADGSIQKLTDADKFLACLAEMQDGPSDLRQHCFYSVLIVGLEDDLFEMLEICSMPYVSAETIRRGVFAAVVSGTLDQWEQACEIGVKGSVGVKAGFETIKTFFGKQYKRLT